MEAYDTERQGSFVYEQIAGGTLVYRQEGHGRRLIGFADVEHWPSVRRELGRRGHGVGATHHLTVVEEVADR